MPNDIQPMNPVQVNETRHTPLIPRWLKITLISMALIILTVGLLFAFAVKNAITTYTEDGSPTKTVGPLTVGQTGESFGAKFTVNNPRTEQGPFNEILCFDIKVDNPATNDKTVSLIPANFTLHGKTEDKSISLLSKSTTLNESTYDIPAGETLEGGICFNLDEEKETKYTLGYARLMFVQKEQLKWKVDLEK